MAAIQQNPANMMQYMNNPKVMKVVTKLQGKFAGMGGGMLLQFVDDDLVRFLPQLISLNLILFLVS